MLLRYALGTAVATVVIVAGGYFVLRSVAIDEAKRNTRTKVVESGQLVESALVDGLVTGDAAARRTIDDLVVGARAERVDRPGQDLVARTAAFSTRTIPARSAGATCSGTTSSEILRDGGAVVEVSNLDRPENVRDRGQGKLIEAYTPIRTPSGTPVLFEIYERLDSVNASARRLLSEFAPPILGAIALLVLVQVPLVWSLMRGLQRGYEDREALLANAIAGSNRERRRLAAYLHDGPVQDIAGVAYSLAPVADNAAARGDDGRGHHASRPASTTCATASAISARCSSTSTRRTSRPPGSRPRSATSSAHSRSGGIEVESSVAGAEHIGQEQEALVYRAAQEAIRNIVDHAQATHVTVVRRRARRRRGPARRHRRRPRLQCRTSGRGASTRDTSASRCSRSSCTRRAGRSRSARRAGEGTTRRAGGAGPMTRVVIADDHGVLRDGLGRVIAAQPDLELVGTRRERRRGSRALPGAVARRRADGSRDAGAGRYRGDAARSLRSTRRSPSSC